MKRIVPIVLAAACAATTALCGVSMSALAQQKTAKECSTEWRANKAENQAKGITERAYVAQCRAGAAGAATAPGAGEATPPPTASSASTSPPAQRKTARECSDEWLANKADFQAKRISERAYVTQCRAGAVAAEFGDRKAAPAPSGTTAPANSPAATSPRGANEFATENEAKAHCPADVVIWANLDSKIYHFHGSREYGSTKKGAYMCEKDATTQGIRAAKNEKRPS